MCWEGCRAAQGRLLLTPPFSPIDHHSQTTTCMQTFEHVLEALAFVGMCIMSGQPPDDLAAVEWAIWFHDIVYDARCVLGPAAGLID